MAKTLQENYCNEIHEHLKYYAAWLPQQQFVPGMYGILQDEQFTSLGNVTDFGVNISIASSPAAHLSYQSSNVSTTQVNSESDNAGIKAGLKIEFGSENSCFLRLSDCKAIKISNLQNVSLELLGLRENKKWDDDWVVILEVIEAGKSFICLNNEKGACVELGIAGGVEQFLDDLSVGFKTLSTSKITTYVEGTAGLTPIFKVGKIRKAFLSYKPPRFRPLSEATGSAKSVAEDYYIFEEIN